MSELEKEKNDFLTEIEMSQVKYTEKDKKDIKKIQINLENVDEQVDEILQNLDDIFKE